MIELKHLTPYLPYGLKIRSGLFVIHTMSVHADRETEIGIMTVLSNKANKPILRPLSDLQKMVDNENTDWIDKINEERTDDYNHIQLDSQCDFDILRECFFPLKSSIHVLEILFKYHFDVFGLIEQNLAIDINTL